MIWEVLFYISGAAVAVGAFIRAWRLEGWQQFAYYLYSINTILLIVYSCTIGDFNILHNQIILMITNVIGWWRWRGH